MLGEWWQLTGERREGTFQCFNTKSYPGSRCSGGRSGACTPVLNSTSRKIFWRNFLWKYFTQHPSCSFAIICSLKVRDSQIHRMMLTPAPLMLCSRHLKTQRERHEMLWMPWSVSLRYKRAGVGNIWISDIEWIILHNWLNKGRENVKWRAPFLLKTLYEESASMVSSCHHSSTYL